MASSSTSGSSSSATGRRRLGRGLGSLISAPVAVEPPVAPPPRSAPQEAARSSARSSEAGPPADDSLDGLRSIAIDRIQPDPRQPRQRFDETALQQLANSISASGLMQPIVVRPSSGSGTAKSTEFQIIAGERRWRAAQRAGLTKIPAVVREVDDRTAAELSLVENLQREDLNPIERADAFKRLIDEFQLTHQDIAQQVGLDRSSITNHLRLLELDEPTREAVREGLLTLGHAKALLAITNITKRRALAGQAVRGGWSVRETERRARLAQQGGEVSTSNEARPITPAAANTADLERKLGEHLGTKVQLHPGRTKGAGRLVIEFFSLDQFEGLLRQLGYKGD